MKTKKIITNRSDLRYINLNNQNIETVTEYVYLGQIMKMNKENKTAKTARRVRLTWAGFGKFRLDSRYYR